MGIALHLTWPSFDAEFLRTGGLRALGLTLAPSANVFKLPDMTAGGVFQGAKPLIYQQRSEVQSPLTLLAVENTVCTKLFCHLSIFFNFCKIRIFRLSDEDFLELAERGCDTQQIARTLNSDINLVALKADTLISQGYRLRQQEHCNDFLRYNK